MNHNKPNPRPRNSKFEMVKRVMYIPDYFYREFQIEVQLTTITQRD